MASNKEVGGGFWPQWNENKLFALLLAILLVYGIIFVWCKTRQVMLEANHIGIADRTAPYISVTATDSAMISPDIATVDLGFTINAATAGDAQKQATDKMSALTAALKALGIEDKDLKTSGYNVYPQYDYDQTPATIAGYEASQTLTVKIREQAKVSEVLSKAGDLGVTNVSSLRFEVDDESTVQAEAREKAIAKAYEQAFEIAKAMDARIIGVVSYSESNGGSYYPGYLYAESADMGSAISPGENEVEMTVYIEFAIE